MVKGFKERAITPEEIKEIHIWLVFDKEGNKVRWVGSLVVKTIWWFYTYHIRAGTRFTNTQLKTICCALMKSEKLREKCEGSFRIWDPLKEEYQKLEHDELIKHLSEFCQDE